MRSRGRFAIADLYYEGRLAEMLRDWRAEGLTFRGIAEKLDGDGILVSYETVRTWCREVGA